MKIGFAGLLALVFITLKLTNTITWSWWWVLSPLWVSVIVWLVLIAFFIIMEIIEDDKRRKLYFR